MTEMLIATDKLAESEAYIAKLLTKKETQADGFLFLNTLLNRSADKKPILGMIQSLAKPYPNVAEAHFAIAQAAWAVGQDKLAMSSLEKAESLKPSWPVAVLFKGQLLYTKSPAEAINYYKAFLKKQPRENEVRVSLAKLYLSEKNYPAAKAEFPTILKNAKSAPDGKLAEMTAVIGLMAFQAHDYPTADTYLMQALDSGFKETEQLFIYLGQSASAQNRDAVAKNWFEKVMPGAHFLDAQLNLANVILKTQGINQAIDHLDGINDLTTEQQIIVIQTQALMFSREKRHDEAFALLEKAVNNLPNTPELVYDYALAAERVSKLDIMEKELRKVIAAKPDYAAAYNALGYSFADRNMKLDEALVLIETALSITPNDHYMLDSLGWVHYRKGNLDLALEHLQKAYDMNPDAEIAAHLGEVLWQKGQQDEAKAIWEKALSADPKNEVLLVITNKFKT
jgi:tetratricopeptide (TPR) repeat protein